MVRTTENVGSASKQQTSNASPEGVVTLYLFDDARLGLRFIRARARPSRGPPSARRA
jgi:hypothetical protein